MHRVVTKEKVPGVELFAKEGPMDVYEQLRAKLATHPMGAPERASILEILRILFTPEEAATALSLPFKPGRDSEIARGLGLPVDDKGLVYAFESRGRHFYML
jgi:hypothetical protein